MTPANSGVHLLVVDDDLGHRETLFDIFEAAGYRVWTAPGEREALELLQSQPVAIALLDLRLEGGSSLGLLSELKRLYPETAVYIMTAFATLENTVAALNAGADGYFLKPLNLDEVKIVFENQLAQQRLRLEKRLLERAVRVSEDRYRSLVENLPVVVYSTTPEGAPTFLSPAVEQLLGYSPAELLARPQLFRRRIDPRDRGRVARERKQLLLGQPLTQEYRLRHRDRRVLELLDRAQPVLGADGALIAVDGILEDLTQRKRSAEALRRERDRAQRYLNTAEVILLALDEGGRIRLINRKGCRVLGYEEQELIGRNWFETCIAPAIREQIQALHRQAMAGKVSLVEYHENEVLTRAGEARMIAWHNTALTDEEGRIVGTLSSGEDITERRRLQAELVHAERMASIGRISAQVAHEIRNPLASVSLNVELLADELRSYRDQDTDEALTIVAAILKEVERLSGIVEEYLQYSRLPTPRLARIDLNVLVDELLEFTAGGLIPAKVELVWKPNPKPTWARADPDQVRQVLLNLIKNAIEAMPNGGTIVLATRSAGAGAEIEVRDDGPGIRAEDLGKIFDPFYTTKEVGTGLGLTLAQQLLEKQSGAISCESEPDHGTTFRIRLPADGSSPPTPNPIDETPT